MTKKKTTKTQPSAEFRVRKIKNGYIVTIWDSVNYEAEEVIYCPNRIDVIDTISSGVL